MSDFAALKASITRPRKAIRLCLRGDLFAERERILRDLAREVEHVDSLAGSGAAAVLRARLSQLEIEMDGATHTFTFEALSRSTFADLEDTHPAAEDGAPSRQFLTALVAASLVEPELTTDNVAELFDTLSDGQVDVLETAAWAVNRETGSVPFSESD
jgi:hypothetical protein